MKKILFLLLFIFQPFNLLSAAEVAELKLPASLLTNVVNNQLKGLQIHLNNYGSKRKNSWYKGGDSYYRIHGKKSAFPDIPPINKGPFRYYLNDVNLKSSRVSVQKGVIVIRLNFEDNGTEIKGRCDSKKLRLRILCVKGDDNTAPDIQMNNAVAYFHLKPIIKNGSVTYGKVSADFSANIKVGKTCEALGCNKVFDYKNRIKKIVQSKLRSVIDNNNTRNKISTGIRKALDKQRIIGKILSLRLSGKTIIVKFEVKT